MFQELLNIWVFQIFSHMLIGYAYFLLIFCAIHAISSTWFWVRPLWFSDHTLFHLFQLQRRTTTMMLSTSKCSIYTISVTVGNLTSFRIPSPKPHPILFFQSLPISTHDYTTGRESTFTTLPFIQSTTATCTSLAGWPQHWRVWCKRHLGWRSAIWSRRIAYPLTPRMQCLPCM